MSAMPVDAISLEVFKNLFASVAEEMGITLQRAAFSPNIRERLDFSCAVFDAQARMVAQAAHIPVHLGSMPAAVEYAVQAFDTFHTGDVIILNDPYRGGTHLPDITMVSPIFVNDTVRFFVASRAHHADVGGMTPGSLPLSTEIYQEGIIIPPLKLVDAGIRNDGILSLITANSRAPQERIGDLEAQLASHRVGEQRLLSMIGTYGIESVERHADALMAYSRRMTEAVIAAIPDGVYSFEDALEGDGQTEYPIPIHATITVNGSAMYVDFTGSAPQVRGNLNAVPAIVRSATWYCVRLLATEDVPVNHGCFEPVTVTVPPRSVLNPEFPAGVAVGNTETSQRIVDVVLGALAQALPDRIPAASQGTMNNVTFGGTTPDGVPFVYYETIAGGHGASPQGDGLSGRHSHMTNTRNTPVEALEQALPVRVLEYSIHDLPSDGKGRFTGGGGIRRIYEFLVPVTVTLNTERRKTKPYGLQGGDPGFDGRNWIIRRDEELSDYARQGQSISAKYSSHLETGDRLCLITPGGGGWGIYDLRNATFDELVEFWFDTPTQGKLETHWGSPIYKLEFPEPIKMIEFYTQLFSDPLFLLERFSTKQINDGFYGIPAQYNLSLGRHAHIRLPALFYNYKLPLSLRETCIRAMFHLFEHIFGREELAHPAGYMWWELLTLHYDVTRIYNAKTLRKVQSKTGRRIQDVMFETLTRILQLDSWYAQEAALHGLNHLHHPETEAIVMAYLAAHPDLGEYQRKYALHCMRGEWM